MSVGGVFVSFYEMTNFMNLFILLRSDETCSCVIVRVLIIIE